MILLNPGPVNVSPRVTAALAPHQPPEQPARAGAQGGQQPAARHHHGLATLLQRLPMQAELQVAPDHPQLGHFDAQVQVLDRLRRELAIAPELGPGFAGVGASFRF